MPAKIAALFVDLTLNTAKFIAELDKSRTKSTVFGVAVGTVFADIGKSAARLAVDFAAAVPRAFLGAAESLDHLAKTAERTRITVETLAALRHQASLSDVSFESLTGSVAKFTRNVGEAIAGSEKQADTMRALGIDLDGVRAGTVSVEEALFGAIDTLSKTTNQFQKIQLGTDAFGRSFSEIVPIINEGSAGFAKARDEAQKLGLILGPKTTAAAEEFNDNLTRIKAVAEGIALQFTGPLLSSLVAVTQGFLDFATEGDRVAKIGAEIADGLKTGLNAVLLFGQGSVTAATGLALLAESVARLRLQAAEGLPKFLGADTNFLKKELEARSARVDELSAILENIRKLQNDIDEAFADGGKAGVPAGATAGAGQAGEDAGNAFVLGFREALSSLGDPIRAVQDELNRLESDQSDLGIARTLTGNLEASIKRMQEFSSNIVAAENEAAALGARLEGFPIALTDAANAVSSIDLSGLTGGLPQAAQDIADLDAAFERLGLTSGFALSGTAAQAQKDFAAISESGQASTSQIVAAFVRTQEAIKASAESGFGAWTKEQEKALVRSQAELDKIGSKARSTQDLFIQLSHSLSSGFEDAILSGEGLRGTLDGILEDIGRVILRATVTGPNGILGTLLSGLGGAIGGIFGGGGSSSGLINAGIESRAAGGPVSGGTVYRVHPGEAFFTPTMNGTVGRAGTSGGSGDTHVTIPQNITIHTGARPEEIVRALRATHDAAVQSAIGIIAQRQLRTA